MTRAALTSLWTLLDRVESLIRHGPFPELVDAIVVTRQRIVQMSKAGYSSDRQGHRFGRLPGRRHRSPVRLLRARHPFDSETD